MGSASISFLITINNGPRFIGLSPQFTVICNMCDAIDILPRRLRRAFTCVRYMHVHGDGGLSALVLSLIVNTFF